MPATSGRPALLLCPRRMSNLTKRETLRFVHGWRPFNYVLSAGIDAGRSATRTVKADANSRESQAVFRPRFEADLYRGFFAGDRKVVGVDAHYTVRLPRTAEPFQRASLNDGEPILTTKPRHHVETNVNVFLNKGTAITTTYMWGSLPPSFEFVDHQVTIGFTILLAREKKSE
jgi:hypothetical protein